MHLNQTLDLIRRNEKATGAVLKQALLFRQHRIRSNLEIISRSDAFYLPAVSAHARIKWGRIFIQQVYEFFNVADDDDGPNDPVFFVTLADKSHLTTDQPQQINLKRMKRKFASALSGLSYVSMIEPGYYNNIYDEASEQHKNIVSWHGHFLVWGVNKKGLHQHLEKIKGRFTPITPGRCPVHKKAITPDQFGYKLWYMLKSPCKEYAIGRRLEPDPKAGGPKYKQNSRSIRPGHCVKLFHLMRDMHLDELAMAGGEGRDLLRRIKYKGLRDYRRKYGWHDRRP